MKQVIILRADLGMTAGKAAAQSSHTSLIAFLNVARQYPEKIQEWFATGQGKIILEVNSLEDLKRIYSRFAKDDTGKKICYLVLDGGITELKG